MDMNQCINAVYVANENGSTEESVLIHEKITEIRLLEEDRGPRMIGSVSCTPCDLEELVCGWMFSEGLIREASDIGRISFAEEEGDLVALVQIRQGRGACSEPGCTRREGTPGGASQVMKERNLGISEDNEDSGSSAGWDAETMRQVYRLFREDPPLHDLTGAAHSCMIIRRGPKLQMLYRSEDAGRHSALDKAIGWAMLRRVDLSDCLLMTSGRISTRMAVKAARVGAGALAGKGTVTAEAVDIADRNRMTLIGRVNESSAVWFRK